MEAAAKDRAARTARSQVLDLRLNPSTRRTRRGQVRRRCPIRGWRRWWPRAAKPRIAWAVTGSTCAASMARPIPSSTTRRIRVDAEAIDLTLSPRRMVAKGKVRSVLQPSKPKAGAAGGTAPGPARRRGSRQRDRGRAHLRRADPARASTRDSRACGRARRSSRPSASRSTKSKGDLGADGGVVTTLALAPENRRRRSPRAPGPPSCAAPPSAIATRRAPPSTTRRRR